jgi:predicted DNA-binding transcriptional regulator AlpA
VSADSEPAAIDVRALAEAVVDVLAERGLAMVVAPQRVLSAAQVAQLLGRSLQWVYAHAGELGAFRYGDGPKARLGFDHARIERWKRERVIEAPARRRPISRARAGAVGTAPVSLIPYDDRQGAKQQPRATR